MPDTPDMRPPAVSLARQDLIAGIVEALGICGGEVPSDEKLFWHEVATRLGLTVRSKVLAILVRDVLKTLEVEWDEDFVDDDGTLTIAVYETLQDAVKRFMSAAERKEAGDIDEDDDQSLADLRFDFQIEQSANWRLKSVYDDIRDGHLVLSPEWQRNFVWKAKKQKRLIESILLRLPIPSFLIFHNSSTGRMYVIDGRQRLETIARFRAEREPKGASRIRFKTFPKSEPGWQPGDVLEDAAGKYYDQLPDRFKTIFDQTPLVMALFRDIPLARLYQVFKRYNTGAVALNAAEIRNAVYQASPVHEMLFRLGGEQRPQPRYLDENERRVSVDLRETMQNKTQRYGAYDFIGRYFAFAYQKTGSVAKATVEFMDRFASAEPGRVEELRREFIGVFETARNWYSSFLIDPAEARFHAFLGTLQLVSTRIMLGHIDSGRVDADAVKAEIDKHWLDFARNRLSRKQNSTLFWGSQKTWVSKLEAKLVLDPACRTYPDYDWEYDLSPLEPLPAE